MPDLNKPQNQWNNNSQQGNTYIPNQYNQSNPNQFNNYQNQPNNMGYVPPQQPNNFGYMPPPQQQQQQPKPKSPKLIYIILIAVIIFFAVIIVLMSTSIRAMFNGGNNQPENNDNIIAAEDEDEREEEDEEEEEEEEEETTEEEITEPPTTTTTAEPVTEVVTVTVVVEVEKEVIKEVEVPVQNNNTVYSDSYYGYVATQKDPLNIRSGAGKSYKVKGSIPKGTYIYVQKTSDSGWYYTTYNGVSGYVSADYVALDLSGGYSYDYGHPGYVSMNTTAKVKTNGSNLYLRDAPSMNGNILDRMPNGTTITVIEEGGDWCYVEYNGTYGYASTQYLAF